MITTAINHIIGILHDNMKLSLCQEHSIQKINK